MSDPGSNGLDTKTLMLISRDVACGHKPGHLYTPAMKKAYAEMAAELEAARKENPGAYVHTPCDLEGLPGPDDD